MPPFSGKRCQRSQAPVHDETPPQEDQVKLGIFFIRVLVRKLDRFVDGLFTSRGIELSGRRGQQGRSLVRFHSVCGGICLGSGSDSPTPGNHKGEDKDEEEAPHKSKLSHQPAVVALVELKGGRGVHLDEEGSVAGGQLHASGQSIL